MKKFIVTKAQLNEYIEKKKTEKVFFDIVTDLHQNQKYLNENISKHHVNQSVIDNYHRKNLITPRVNEMLIKYGIINEKRQII
jgi:hypothetical protein